MINLGSVLSSEIIEYIDRVTYHIPVSRQLSFVIESREKLDEEEKNKLENNIKTHYGLIIMDKSNDLIINALKAFWLFSLGITFLLSTYYLSNMVVELIIEILSIVGSFALWESASSTILERKEIRIDKLNARQVYNSEIKFKDDKK